MLKYADPVDDVFRALSDPTRRQMVERLGTGPATVSQLAEPLAMSLSAVVQHLGVLQSCGLVRTEKVGRVRTCRLETARLRGAEEWFAGQRAAWERRLDRLGQYLEESDGPAGEAKSQQHQKEEEELQMPHQTEMTERRTEHATFVIERTYDAPPSRVFAAWASREAKAKWFGAMEGDEGYVLDFRVDGIEAFKGGPDGGPVFSYENRYHDIVPDRRIASSYVMDMDGVRISVSLAVVELEPAGAGTKLTLTEHGVYLDGLDTVEQRREGVSAQIDKLGTTLS